MPKYIVATHEEAEAIILSMVDVGTKHGQATVSDLKSLINEPSNYTDEKWGWTTLEGWSVQETAEGHILNVPDPTEL